MKTSESVSKIFAAIAKAQAAMKPVAKDANNPFFSSKYAKLDSIVDELRPIMADNGLGFIQSFRMEDGRIVCVTRLIHESGEWCETECPLKLEKDTPQGAGSAQTYARRYGFQAAIGAVFEEDDDGNAAEQSKNSATVLPKQPEQKPAAKAAVPATQPRPTGSPRYDAANAAIGKLKAGESDRAAEFFGKTIGYHIDGELTQEQVKALVMAIDAKDTNNRESRWYEIAGNGSSPAYKDAQKFAELLEYLQKMGAVSENIASNTLNMLAQNLPTS